MMYKNWHWHKPRQSMIAEFSPGSRRVMVNNSLSQLQACMRIGPIVWKYDLVHKTGITETEDSCLVLDGV